MERSAVGSALLTFVVSADPPDVWPKAEVRTIAIRVTVA
jgi:hypothetical protein